LGSEPKWAAGSGLDSERLLDLAARLVLAGLAPSVSRLARSYPGSEHHREWIEGKNFLAQGARIESDEED
jgi:hypothetical protein